MTEAGIALGGVVSEALPSAVFRVDLDNRQPAILATTAGKMRRFRIRVVASDHVTVWPVRFDARANHVPSHRVAEGT